MLTFSIALAISGCERPNAAGGGKARPSASADQPNVLLVVLDTTRADRIGCYGHAAAHTPVIDRLAAEGVRFTNARCQVPLTLPSHASLLTGQLPPTTGLRINGAAVLGDTLPTLAERFQEHGYRTGAFVSAWVLSRVFGLDRGFDHYDDAVSDTGDAELHAERRGDRTTDAVLQWLDSAPEARFFAWVHLFDPHSPYEPPAEYAQKCDDPYDGEIAFADAQVGRLVAWLDAHALREKTLIVVVADHGEAFGERGEREHGLLLYDVTMHVPLVIAQPGRVSAGHAVEAVVGLVDLMPTLLGILGWDAPADLAGVSFAAALQGKEFDPLPQYGETEYPFVGFGWAPLRSYTTQRWKYVAAPRPELYDLEADPGEKENALAAHADVAAELEHELLDWVQAIPQTAAEAALLDDETRHALESLGYVGVGAGTPEPGVDAAGGAARELRDPKDMVDVYQGLARAKALQRAGAVAQAVEILEPLAARSPESDELRGALGEAYLKLRRFADAERELRASLRRVDANPQKRIRVGDALIGQGEVAEAERCYARALEISPAYDTAHNRLGALYFRQKQFERALKHFQKDLILNPDSPMSLTNVASVLPHVGRAREAVEPLQRALALDARHEPAHRLLWQVLVATGQHAEAAGALRAATKALPADTDLKRSLAGLLISLSPRGAEEALGIAQGLCQAESERPENYDVLGMGYARVGRFADAIAAADRALELATQQGQAALAEQIAARRQAYEQGRLR